MTVLSAPLVGLLTATATAAVGALALRLGHRLSRLLGFSGGAMLGIALFDMLPEAVRQVGGPDAPAKVGAAVVCGFALYLVTERLSPHRVREARGYRGHLAAACLTGHSLMDGLAIGFAFRVSPSFGLTVTIAVLAHDLLDGANTVALSLGGGVNRRAAMAWLAADAIAPLLGIGITYLTAPSPAGLGILLALFAGGFLHIGGSEALPHTEERTRAAALLAPLAGMALVYLIVSLTEG